MLYALCVVLIAIGIYGVVVKKNIVKIVISLVIMEYGINLLFVMIGYRTSLCNKVLAPIVDKNTTLQQIVSCSVDPLPQAFVFISIIVGLAILLFMTALCIRLYQRYETFDITKIKRLKG
jgi:multicomponent Na+:H+ antiporter subunit C